MDKLEEEIEQKLSEYIGFDIKEIINKDIDMAHVFGGAVRDIIAGKEIHDVDILCMYESMRKITKILEKNDYFVHSSLTIADIQSMYTDIHVIIEPITFMKVIGGEIRLIQLIRPGETKIERGRNYNNKDTALAITNFYYLLGQVDMSNCAVHYSSEYGLKESYYGAIKHCKQQVFVPLDTEMRSDRFHKRVNKFTSRGWSNIYDLNQKQYERVQKLELLISDGERNYYMPPPGPIVTKKSKYDDELDALF